MEIPRGREVIEIRNRNDGRGFSRQVGEVESFNRAGLVLKTSDGTTTIAAHLVSQIHYQKSDEHRLGDLHFRQKNFRDALTHYKKARALADRQWVEVQLMEQTIRCESALGFHSQAISDFTALAELEPEMADSTFACIPLAWQAIPGDVRIEETAARLLRANANVPVEVVLCGSYLLFSPQMKEVPQRMKIFASNRDERLAQMAEAQTWRLELTTVTPEKAAQWRDRIETFPPELRGGPCFVLGRAFLNLKDFDSAALAFLKTALVYDQNPALAAEALRLAQTSLEQGGHPEEAKALKKD